MCKSGSIDGCIMGKQFYAHSLEDKPPEKWQLLENHLEAVAIISADFARSFGGENWARLAGLWHDAGKYSDDFQAKLMVENGFEAHLETNPGRVIHSQAGGHLAQLKNWKGIDRVISWLIMGHHTGLADFSTDKTGAKALEPKMRDPDSSTDIFENIPDQLKNQREPLPPKILLNGGDASFFIRMLFSCIVDADFLDTEAFMDRDRAKLRDEEYPTLEELLPALDQYMDQICSSAETTPVNKIRAEVLMQCRTAAQKKPDVFSLTVPTGGGKTLSSLVFALHHAVAYHKKHIIYVIPYTSIIEQTAEVFRDIPEFGNVVLEHHCNVSKDDETKESVRSRLATENWDAPIIVTTSVQFFESLYACKTSRCRKLHNIANSVVIFDEAQCLPPKYLRPVAYVIRELHRHYGVTPVLCTATQPVLTQTKQFDFNFREGFESVTEIVSKPNRLAKRLKRVEIELYFGSFEPAEYEEIASAILSENQSVLCIVNKKNDCRRLARLLPKKQTIHLSTNMCAEHRFQTFREIKERMNTDDKPLFVISTSLVEAGVDLDFPVVYRALAGIDSIAQAAGRCNREGKLQGFGKTVVFVPSYQPQYVRQPADLAREHLEKTALNEFFLPENFRKYFEQRFWQLGENMLDEKGILNLFSGNLDFYFRTAAERFHLIDDDWQLPLIVPFGESHKLADRLIHNPWNYRKIFRRLQRFTINIPEKVHRALIDQSYARELIKYPGTYILDTSTLYNDRFGFIPPDEIDGYDPQETIV